CRAGCRGKDFALVSRRARRVRPRARALPGQPMERPAGSAAWRGAHGRGRTLAVLARRPHDVLRGAGSLPHHRITWPDLVLVATRRRREGERNRFDRGPAATDRGHLRVDERGFSPAL